MVACTRTPEKVAAFLSGLRLGASVSLAARNAGIPRQTVYEWRDQSEQFRKDWDDAVEEGTDGLEDAARTRAQDGVDEPVFYQGEVCGAVRKYSDTLMIFLLKARRPEKFRDNFGQPAFDPFEKIAQAMASVNAIDALTSGGVDESSSE